MNETDQEQIESLKQFWAQWGNAIIAIVVLLAVLMIGSNVWSDSVRKSKETVSDEYQLVVQLLSENAQLDSAQQLALSELSNGMKHKYPDSIYTNLAALNVAQQSVVAGKLDNALIELDYVIAKSGDQSMIEIATERKAKILLEKGDFDAALTAISLKKVETMTVQFLETKGDILVKQGNVEDAKVAYQSAIDQSVELRLNSKNIKQKLNDITIAQ
ncbi:YfgM family protein [Marinicellulosiphila megalodicopiae]|uniref:YfgM family protein n=1 Tax=Marinicellulosiphila megalodicopiae TaxID=2724896 RepID=UPI003BAE345B